MKKFKLPISVKIVITLFVIALIYSFFSSVYSSSTTIYNQSIGYNLSYDQIGQEQITAWDADYLCFIEKSNITEISKETFLRVTNIIMTARTDGANLAWKWNQENQQIPYEEFTVFYKDLSAFVMLRFEANKTFERKKQQIVQAHNLLLTTFPGVIYNYFLELPLMEYKEGFVSLDTQLLFNK